MLHLLVHLANFLCCPAQPCVALSCTCLVMPCTCNVLRSYSCTDVLNLIVPYLISPLYGVPAGAYRLHHVVMHHVEDNAAGWDLSSTELYQRDSLYCFLQ